MNNNIMNYDRNMFETAKQHDRFFVNLEFWYARDIQQLLNYTKWGNFESVLEAAIINCVNSGINPNEHFVEILRPIVVGNGGVREIKDYMLTRYACYCIMLNADPRKPTVAAGKNYFIEQTRRQELEDDWKERVELRDGIKGHNREIASTAARNAGFNGQADYARFHNAGYIGLYDGMTCADIREMRGLPNDASPLDYMGGLELSANYFQREAANTALKMQGPTSKENANRLNFNIGRSVRGVMEDYNLPMPETLPVVENIREIRKELNTNNRSMLTDGDS